MKYLKEFPLYNSKVGQPTSHLDLTIKEDRNKYFQIKAAENIKKIKDYLENGGTFIAYLLAKKSAGKGTYTKLMIEIFGEDKISHISVGDIVRKTYLEIQDSEKKGELKKYLEQNYRGFMSADDALDALANKRQDVLLPTEFTLALVKKEIQKQGPKVLFIDGFPRELPQVSYALFFKDLIDFRADKDFFIAIDAPEAVIEARMNSRVVCPKCQSPWNMKFLPTEFVGRDEKSGEFYLMCDDPKCDKARMVGKDGDSSGLESIRERLNTEGELINKIFALHGIDKILMRSSLPKTESESYCENYELTKEFFYIQENNGGIKTNTKDFSVIDDEGDDVVSLTSSPVMLQLLDQLVKVLNL